MGDEANEELELGYLECPRAEKVGVTGEGFSEGEDNEEEALA